MQAVVVTGPGGSGVSTVAAALAVAATAAGRRVRLACLADDGSLADLVAGAPPELRPRPLALTEPGRWDVFDQAVADGLVGLGAEGVAAEEMRHLPSVGPLRAVVRLAEASLGVDLLILDAGPFAAASDLLDTATRLPWVLRRCLGAQAAAGRALGASAVELSRLVDRAAAGAELLGGGRTRVDVVLPDGGRGPRKVRRALPGLILQGCVPGLLVHSDPRAGQPEPAVEESGASDWAPLTPVRPTCWPRADPTGAAQELTALGTELHAAWEARPGRGDRRGRDGAGYAARAVAGGHDTSGPRDESLRVTGNTLVWRLPLPWAAPTDLHVERRADDLLVRLHGRTHLLPMPAAARRGRVLHVALDGRTLAVDVELPERGWGSGS